MDGSKGTACIPGREAEFKAGVALALTYAEILNCPRIHLMAGLIPEGLTREDAQGQTSDWMAEIYERWTKTKPCRPKYAMWPTLLRMPLLHCAKAHCHNLTNHSPIPDPGNLANG